MCCVTLDMVKLRKVTGLKVQVKSMYSRAGSGKEDRIAHLQEVICSSGVR